jgi:hypothetical protein
MSENHRDGSIFDISAPPCLAYSQVVGEHVPREMAGTPLPETKKDLGVKSLVSVSLSLWWYQGLTSGPVLVSQVLYHLSHTLNPLCFSYFSNRVCVFAWARLGL